MYPQYLAYLLTGRKGAEPTYLGCHGWLLDASGERYSIVAEKLGVTALLPPFPLSRTWEPLGTLKPGLARETGLSPETIVTMGAHDSNAALVPYFVKGYDDFVVQDSGTWVVTMSPRDRARFEEGELGKEVFFNRSIYGTPIKTTIFRGGAEFDFYRTKVLPQCEHPRDIDFEALADVLGKREAFALPTLERGSGLFPGSVARLVGIDTIFHDAASAWTVVDLGLAVQGYLAIRMAGGDSPSRIFIEGNIGRHNAIYRSVISTLFPQSDVAVRLERRRGVRGGDTRRGRGGGEKAGGTVGAREHGHEGRGQAQSSGRAPAALRRGISAAHRISSLERSFGETHMPKSGSGRRTYFLWGYHGGYVLAGRSLTAESIGIMCGIARREPDVFVDFDFEPYTLDRMQNGANLDVEKTLSGDAWKDRRSLAKLQALASRGAAVNRLDVHAAFHVRGRRRVERAAVRMGEADNARDARNRVRYLLGAGAVLVRAVAGGARGVRLQGRVLLQQLGGVRRMPRQGLARSSRGAGRTVPR